MIIHQPRYSIFKLFDTLTLLSQGQIVYHGNPHASLEYFESLGIAHGRMCSLYDWDGITHHVCRFSM